MRHAHRAGTVGRRWPERGVDVHQHRAVREQRLDLQRGHRGRDAVDELPWPDQLAGAGDDLLVRQAVPRELADLVAHQRHGLGRPEEGAAGEAATGQVGTRGQQQPLVFAGRQVHRPSGVGVGHSMVVAASKG
jgi:hypothetical protein